MCAKLRAQPFMFRREYGSVLNDRHVVKRTGRERANKTNNHPPRSLTIDYEYVCSCGHRGWSRHVDVLRQPLVEEVGKAATPEG